MITLDQFAESIPCLHSVARTWHPIFEKVMDRWEINSMARVAGFLAQMSHESQKFTRFTENLNYSVTGLANTWPDRFAVEPKAKIKAPNSLAQAIGRNSAHACDQQKLAGIVYGGRYGNRPGTDDGWKYRGRGPKQITFRANYEECGNVIGIDLVSHPEMLLIPEYGANAAGWYWYSRGCNVLMDSGNYKRVSEKINGGLNGYEDGNTVGLDDRVELWVHVKKVLGIA